jgi:hypothetical protein
MRMAIIRLIYLRSETFGTFQRARRTLFKVSCLSRRKVGLADVPGLEDDNEYLLVFDDGTINHIYWKLLRA